MMHDMPNYDLLDNDKVRVLRLEEKHVAKYFPVHQHKYYEIVLITECEGEFSHDIDFVTFPLLAGRVYFIAPGQAHAWNTKTYNKEYKGYLITFYEAFILREHKHLQRQLLKLFDPLDTSPFLEFESAKIDEVFPTLSILEEAYTNHPKDSFILRSLLESLLLYMAKMKFSSTQEMGINCQRVMQVRQHIEKHFKHERSVDFYARKMSLSNKRLNEIVKSLSNKTVTQIIHDRLLLEAKRQIISQSKTLTVISEELGFENPSYFARFFKKHEGLSPSEFATQMFI